MNGNPNSSSVARCRTIAVPPRRGITRLSVLSAVLGVVLTACSGDRQRHPTAPEEGPAPVPEFVFVSDESGTDQLYRFRNDSIVRLTTSNLPDREPHSAAGKIVFSSERDGSAEIYIADADATAQTRLTFDDAFDAEPALSPDGSRIAFMSLRTGSPRLWVMNADASNVEVLPTGSDESAAEFSASWSPAGGHIAFISTRTGMAQVWLIASSGGQAVQVTNEADGAFDPVWSADGRYLYYVIFTTQATSVRRVEIATGEVTAFATSERGTGEVACSARVCVYVDGAYNGNGDIKAVWLDDSVGEARTVVERAGDQRSPAVIVR